MNQFDSVYKGIKTLKIMELTNSQFKIDELWLKPKFWPQKYSQKPLIFSLFYLFFMDRQITKASSINFDVGHPDTLIVTMKYFFNIK
jgi:hypothetical protein